jgi:hypothetical protein
MHLPRSFVALAALAVTSTIWAPAALAQDERPRPARLFLGGYFPSDGDTKDAIGSTEFSWGASFDLPKKKPSPATYAIYFDGVWADADDSFGLEVDFHYLGIGPLARYYPGAKKEASGTPQKSRFYLGGGFGLYFITAQIVDNDGFYVDTLDNDVKLGGKLFAGVELGSALILEGDYTWPGASAGEGWNARVGFRF